jgi:hypothetical protein
MDFLMFAEFGVISGIVTSLAVAAASAAISAAMAPKTKFPKSQGYGEINAGAIQADADTLAVRRELEAAARLGVKSNLPTGEDIPITETRRFITVPAYLLPEQQLRARNLPQNGAPVEVEYNEQEWKPGGIFYNRSNTPPAPYTREVVTGYRPSTETVDFTGLGDADIESKVAEQMAPAMLELEKEYGPQFIAQAKAMQELADPDGTAARKELARLINEEAAATPDRPLADELDRQVSDKLAAGGGLTAEETGIADQLLEGEVGSKGELDAIKESLVLGGAGYQRGAAGQSVATGWLGSGATPEDVAYRRRQQSMANRGSFLSGQTPTAQFGQLSGAQQGAAPTVFGPPLAQVNPNAVGAFAQNAASQYQTGGNYAMQQADPWFAGLSTTIRGIGGVMAARKT